MALRYVRLLPKLINALQPGAQLQEHGIVVKRAKNGDLNWSINTMVDGLRIHRVLGLARDGVNRETAETALEALRTRARDERLSLPQGRKTCKIFSEAADEYLHRLAAENGKGLKWKERHIRLHLKRYFGNVPINKISEARLSSYRTQRKKEGVKDSTVNRELATLSHFFSMAKHKKWRWMSADDGPDVPMTKEAKMPFRILSVEELGKLFRAAAELGEAHTMFLEMMAGSTMRPEEVMQSRLEHVFDHRNELQVPKAKAGPRVQPVTERLANLLRARRARKLKETGEDTGWVFPSPRFGEGRHRVSYAPMFRSIVLRARLDTFKITPYTVRRTSITDVAASRIDLDGLMRITGHKTVVSVLRYVHTRDEEIQRAMRVLELRQEPGLGRPLHQNCTTRKRSRI